MRIKLVKGKQKELILFTKNNLSWRQLSKKLGMNPGYLERDLKNERILLSERFYNNLCKLSGKNFDKFIIERLDDNWGQSKGGLNSPGSIIKLPEIRFDEKLAEFVGAVLGDGHVYYHKIGKKIGVYGIRIAGDLEKDKDYHINYLANLCKSIFSLNASEILGKNERFLDLRSKELVNFFISMGIKPGNKIANQSTIPHWICRNKLFLGACIRGLIDTDGSIFRMSRKDPKLLRINFTNHNWALLNDTRKAFTILGFNPSKIINNRQFFISRQGEIKKYIKEIGFNNLKHNLRLQNFNSPVVQRSNHKSYCFMRP